MINYLKYYNNKNGSKYIFDRLKTFVCIDR